MEAGKAFSLEEIRPAYLAFMPLLHGAGQQGCNVLIFPVRHFRTAVDSEIANSLCTHPASAVLSFSKQNICSS